MAAVIIKIAGMDTFAERLQAALDERNWGPSDLAGKVKVSDDTIRKWLEGRQPKLCDAWEVSQVLDLSLEYLAAGVAPKGPVLSEDEKFVLRLVHEIGVKRAIRRLTEPSVQVVDPDRGPLPHVQR